MKALVAFYSNTGSNKYLAERISHNYSAILKNQTAIESITFLNVLLGHQNRPRNQTSRAQSK